MLPALKFPSKLLSNFLAKFLAKLLSNFLAKFLVLRRVDFDKQSGRGAPRAPGPIGATQISVEETKIWGRKRRAQALRPYQIACHNRSDAGLAKALAKFPANPLPPIAGDRPVLANPANRRPPRRSPGWSLALAIALGLSLTGCALPRVNAEDRLFLPATAEVLDVATIPAREFEGTPVGGLSALAYDRARDRFYALSDDRGQLAPARYYTLRASVAERPGAIAGSGETSGASSGENPGAIASESANERPGFAIAAVEIEAVATLKTETGEPFPPGSLDPEGLALTPRQTLLVASEGDRDRGIDPFVREFDAATGRAGLTLPLPAYYLPAPVDGEVEGAPDSGELAAGALPSGEPDKTDGDRPAPQGIANNQAFESLTTNPGNFNGSTVEPFRAFVATETALLQDADPDDPLAAPRVRILHFLLGDGPPFAISEHLYLADPAPDGAIANGLTELTALDQGGHFLSLERSFSPFAGFGAKLFQVALGGATDTAGYGTLRGDLSGVAPARKRLLVDFSAAADAMGVRLDNLEGMAIGPRLPDGTQSLWVVSDDNFRDSQETQLWLLRLKDYFAS